MNRHLNQTERNCFLFRSFSFVKVRMQRTKEARILTLLYNREATQHLFTLHNIVQKSGFLEFIEQLKRIFDSAKSEGK